MVKKHFLIAAITFFMSFHSFASHIIGGEIYYDSLGDNKYKITLDIYRDCLNFSTSFDNPISYTVFNSDGTIYSTYYVPMPVPNILPVNYDDPCIIPPSNICIERAIYVDTIFLPFNVNGYYVSYQRCCWSNSIQNIMNPGDNGMTITTTIPGSSLVDVYNNCARFNAYPPLILCANNTFDFDHSASDIDGDSLVYSLCSPLSGANSFNAAPDPETPPPYYPITWEAGFSSSLPFGIGSNVTIDPHSGMMSFTPNLLGNFAIGVCVQEYRNGILINEKMRTFAYRVVHCDIQIPITITSFGDTTIIEDCGESGFILNRIDASEDLSLEIILTGSATNGIDYNILNDTVVIPQGYYIDTISITPFLDGIIEGNETVTLNLVVPNICNNTFDTLTSQISIVDYHPLTVLTMDSVTICDEDNETVLLTCNASNGLSPYIYEWIPNGFPNNDSIYVQSSSLNPNVNIFSVTVKDQCFKEILSNDILVINQCDLIIPNVLTLNNDNVNEYFLVRNLEDYNSVEIKVFNRWGNLIYENNNYQNNWPSNENMVDGVYFYIIKPKISNEESDEEYHGFFHIIR